MSTPPASNDDLAPEPATTPRQADAPRPLVRATSPSRALVREVEGPATERGRVAGLAMVCSAAGVALGFALAGSLFAAMSPARSHGPYHGHGHGYRYHAVETRTVAWVGVLLDTTPGAPARVKAIVRNSPAEAVGFQTGDIVTRVDGRSIESGDEMVSAITSYKPGDAVDLEILGVDGKTRTYDDLRLSARPMARR